MTVRTILRMGDPRLLEVAKPVNDPSASEIKALIQDMFCLLYTSRCV